MTYIINPNTTILVTGAAGFIGFHLSLSLLKDGLKVVGYDSIDPYYDVSLKEARIAILETYSNFKMVRANLVEFQTVKNSVEENNIEVIVNLAAQAGVRYSMEKPEAYIESNLKGFFNILEVSRQCSIKHLVYASSSSVYGLNKTTPFSVKDNVDHPVSLYAATKRSNELMAHSYSHLFNFPTTGMRFFTVYGPWGRPDMACFKFCRAIQLGETISLYNEGKMFRDFTYIDDIINGIKNVISVIPQENPSWTGSTPDPSRSPDAFRVLNIGRGNMVALGDFVSIIEEEMGKKAIIEHLPMQPGDVYKTWADVSDLENEYGYTPETDVSDGIKAFVKWFKEFYADGKEIPF